MANTRHLKNKEKGEVPYTMYFEAYLKAELEKIKAEAREKTGRGDISLKDVIREACADYVLNWKNSKIKKG
jgi:hypothetical protein